MTAAYLRRARPLTSRSKPAFPRYRITGFPQNTSRVTCASTSPTVGRRAPTCTGSCTGFLPSARCSRSRTGGTDRDLLKLTIDSQPKGCEWRVRWSSASWSGPTTRGPRLAVLAPASLRRRRRAPFSLPCPLSLPPPRAKPPKKPQKRRKRKNEQKKY